MYVGSSSSSGGGVYIGCVAQLSLDVKHNLSELGEKQGLARTVKARDEGEIEGVTRDQRK